MAPTSSSTTAVAVPTPVPSPTVDSISSVKPAQNSVYHSGQRVNLTVNLNGRRSGAFYKSNPLVTISLHEGSVTPGPAYVLARIPLHQLVRDGYSFKILKSYVLPSQWHYVQFAYVYNGLYRISGNGFKVLP
ncbi:hypothetical protein BGZ54_004291 [Gamsiella multidivaricata]|nr:hypothetical protein BGZ54_004291 [Gamsiella multidivaricata]